MSDYDKPLTRAHARLGIGDDIKINYQGPSKTGNQEWLMTKGVDILTKMAEELGPETGIKHDQEKEPLSLLSRVWLLGVARVMGFGAKKYSAHNWRNGLERSRLLSAALRHILAYNEGEDDDPESGLPHLDHASACLMFARETHETHPSLDDRYKGEKK